MLGRIAFLAASLAAATAASGPPPPVPRAYWDVWVDESGGTHQTKCEFKDFGPFSLGRGVASIDIDKLRQTADAVWIDQFPRGWVGAWHENPKPQWTIPLSGRSFVESTDGHRVEMGPGEASFSGDRGSKPDAAGHVSHLSGTLGDAPITLMFVQGKADAQPDRGCRFR